MTAKRPIHKMYLKLNISTRLVIQFQNEVPD